MSTAPTEAHIDLAVTIYKKRESFPPFDKVKEAAQLIADSEARAVKAAMSMKPEVIAYPALLKIAKAQRERVRVLEEANTWQDKSNAPIERTRVLATYLGVYEPCVGSISDSRFYPDGQSGSEPFTHWMPLPTLAATSEHAKEGSK